MFLILSTVLLIIITIKLINLYKRQLFDKNLQGPTCIPLLGNIKLFTLSQKDVFQYMENLRKSYKKYYRLWTGHLLWVIVYDPEIIEEVLTHDSLEKAEEYKVLIPWLGNGLVLKEGEKWFMRRKAITPSFHFKILEEFIEIFEQQAIILSEKFNTTEIIDIVPHVFHCTLDIICETSMGLKLNAQLDAKSNYAKAFENVANITFKRILNPFLLSDIIFRFTKDYYKYKNGVKLLHETTKKIIKERKKDIQDLNNISTNITNELGQKKKLTFIDTLLKGVTEDEHLSDNDIQDEVNTILFAGHDATGTALSFLLYNLAKNPEVQLKTFKEIKEIFGENFSEKMTLKRLSDLKYLDLVVKESLRLHTTLPLIGRHLKKSCTIGGIDFPDNANIFIGVYAICHDANIFEDPEKFMPERFDIELNNNKISPYAYVPFSAGPRNCIGQKFAFYEMKSIIVKILQKYEIFLGSPDEELVLGYGISLKALNGIKLKFSVRQY